MGFRDFGFRGFGFRGFRGFRKGIGSRVLFWEIQKIRIFEENVKIETCPLEGEYIRRLEVLRHSTCIARNTKVHETQSLYKYTWA